MKELKPEEYISKLDRLTWEYLRESEQYRKDLNLVSLYKRDIKFLKVLYFDTVINEGG